jgi:F-type H+-transporting ATPase subunit delta
MKEKIIAVRYAEAFVAFAAPRIGVQRVVDEMKSLRWLLRENPDLDQFLKAPEVPLSDKARVIDRVFVEGYSDETRDFLKYLIDKSRLTSLLLISDHIRVVYAHGNVVDAVLRSTFPLELETVQAIKDKLEVRLSRKVNLYLELDPDLLGGVQIIVGNSVIDGSVRYKLQELKNKLLKTQVVR